MTTSQNIIKTKRINPSKLTFKNLNEVGDLINLIYEREVLNKSFRTIAKERNTTHMTIQKRYYEMIGKL